MTNDKAIRSAISKSTPKPTRQSLSDATAKRIADNVGSLLVMTKALQQVGWSFTAAHDGKQSIILRVIHTDPDTKTETDDTASVSYNLEAVKPIVDLFAEMCGNAFTQMISKIRDEIKVGRYLRDRAG